jgi:hypothetical protein
MKTFTVTLEEQQKINDWLHTEVYPAIVAKQKKSSLANMIVSDEDGNELPYFGAIGGDVTYQFTPNSIGMAFVVIHGSTGQKLDLTDYESW